MDYVKMRILHVHSPAWLFASCRARGAAASLSIYCAVSENGGKISDCKAWDNEKWKAVAAITRDDVNEALFAGLVSWQDQDLTVHSYDPLPETVARQRRENGAKGGRPRSKEEDASMDGPGDRGEKLEPITIIKTVQGPKKDSPISALKFAGAFIGKDEAGDWEFLCGEVGLDVVVQAIKDTKAAGLKAFYSNVRGRIKADDPKKTEGGW